MRLHVFISGFVQGVSFRSSTKLVADALKVKGWVRNLPDGKVEVVAEGSETDLESFLKWLRKGPEGASIRSVTYRYEDAEEGFIDFSVA